MDFAVSVLTNGLRSFSPRTDDSERVYECNLHFLAASSQFPAVNQRSRSCLLMDFAVSRLGSTILIVITDGLLSSRRGASR